MSQPLSGSSPNCLLYKMPYGITQPHQPQPSCTDTMERLVISLYTMGSGISPYRDNWVIGAQSIRCLSSGWVARPTEVCIWFRRSLASAQMSILGPLPHSGQVSHMCLLYCHTFQPCFRHGTAYNCAAVRCSGSWIWHNYWALLVGILWIGRIETTKINPIWFQEFKHDTVNSTCWAQLKILQDSEQYEQYWKYTMALGTLKRHNMNITGKQVKRHIQKTPVLWIQRQVLQVRYL